MLNEATLDALREHLLGTQTSVKAALSYLGVQGVSVRTAQDRLLDGNGIEQCKDCKTWCEVGELMGDAEGALDGFCITCRSYRGGS